MTNPRLRDQTRLWLTAISTDLRNAVEQEVDALRTSIDQRIAALDTVVSRNDELFDQLTLKVHDLGAEEVQAAVMVARQEAETAVHSEMTAIHVRLQGELDTARAESEVIRTMLETQLAETERDIAVIRRKRDEHAASLDHERRRNDALEDENAQAARSRQVAEARLEEEVQRRTVVEKQLEATRQEVLLAKAEAESCRLEARLAGERAHILENRLLELEHTAGQMRATSALEGDTQATLRHLKKALDDLGSTKSDEVLSRLAEHLSEGFAATAVFAVEAQKLRVWRSRMKDSAVTPISPQALSLESESPLARAFRHRTTVSVEASSTEPAVGLWGTSIGYGIAIPVLAYGRVVALAYGENPPGHSDARVQLLETIAEILVGCINLRLNRSQLGGDLQPASQQANGPSVVDHEPISRKARRVKIDTAVAILVNGVASTLVDLSTSGAQIVSPSCLRPSRGVRLVLPTGSSSLTCEGRIVWARLESARADAPAMYRGGVRFAGADPRALLSFISQHSAAETIS